MRRGGEIGEVGDGWVLLYCTEEARSDGVNAGDVPIVGPRYQGYL